MAEEVLKNLDERVKQRFLPDKQQHSDPLRRLTVTYITIVVVVFLLITGKQLLVSFSIGQERESRAIATTIGRQRSRSLTFLMDSIALKEQTGKRETLLAEIKSTRETWEVVQRAALDPHGSPVLNLPWWIPAFPPSVITQVKASNADYQAILQAVKQIEESKPEADISPQIHVLALHVPTYQTQFQGVFITLSMQADDQVQRLARLEFGLYILTIGCVIFEVFVIVRPTMKDLHKLINALLASQQKQEPPPGPAEPEATV